MARRIPLQILDLKDQRYSCHGCGDCCRDFSVQLRDRDLRRLEEQGWEEVAVEMRRLGRRTRALAARSGAAWRMLPQGEGTWRRAI